MRKMVINMKFNTEQEAALDLLEDGESVFLTGGAGVGKTSLINEFIRRHPNLSLIHI